MVYDGTITLGNVLTILGMLLGFLGMYARFVANQARMEIKIDLMWRKLFGRTWEEENDESRARRVET